MKSSKNVILIGMPGSGKSTVGVVLAKVLGYRFIDSDLEIQSQEGKRLPERDRNGRLSETDLRGAGGATR